jgi:hypothetical protein
MANYLRISLFSVFVFVCGSLLAQPGGHGHPCPKPPCPPAVPITGIEYLIGFGGLYGVKKLLSRAKNKRNEQ